MSTLPYEQNSATDKADLDRKVDIDHKEDVDVEVRASDDRAGADYSGFTPKSDPEEIRLVRKLDCYIMDLGMNDVQYQTAVSILFVGYIFFGVPSNMIITRVKAPLYLCCIMATWAVLSICTAFAKNATHLYITRFFLGALEAPYYPGALFIISNFYTRTEVATRIAILYTGNILATSFAGLIAAGIFQMDGMRGYAGWQWLFIIQGAVTGLVAMISYPFLPNSPLTTRWLTQEQRQMAHDRMQRDRVDQGEAGSTFAGLKQAFKDPRTWLFCLMYNAHLSANGFKNFFPSVISSLGFSRTITLVLTCPPYLIAGVVTLFVSWSSGRYNERTWHITISKAVAIVGFVLAAATLNTPARYVAMCIFTIGTYGVNSIVLGWAGTVLSQTPEKKAVVLAVMASTGTGSFIYTPYLFREDDRPRYTIAMSAMAGFSLITVICAWFIRGILRKQNRTLEETGARTKYPY